MAHYSLSISPAAAFVSAPALTSPGRRTTQSDDTSYGVVTWMWYVAL
jgi:hypothetical protein